MSLIQQRSIKVSIRLVKGITVDIMLVLSNVIPFTENLLSYCFKVGL